VSFTRLERIDFRAMGTECTIAATVRPYDGVSARRALAAGQSEVAACERTLSRFDPASDLCRLNANAGEWTPVDSRLIAALERAARAREETRGLFDASVLPILAALGYDRSFELLSHRPAAAVDGWRPRADVDVDVDMGRARIESGAAVDLGGLGKGFAADRAILAMRAAWPGLPGALVDLGGDIAVSGATPETTPWRLAVADPRAPGGTIGQLHVGGGGVATSGPGRRRFGPDRRLHHLIDPVLAAPAVGGPLSVTVVAASAVDADVHATALALLNPHAAAAYVASRPQLAALQVTRAGERIELGELHYHATEGVAA
jgi:FAD:protein FMN transferase